VATRAAALAKIEASTPTAQLFKVKFDGLGPAFWTAVSKVPGIPTVWDFARHDDLEALRAILKVRKPRLEKIQCAHRQLRDHLGVDPPEATGAAGAAGGADAARGEPDEPDNDDDDGAESEDEDEDEDEEEDDEPQPETEGAMEE